MLECFAKFIELGNEPCQRVEVPYEGTTLPALLVPPRGTSGSGTPAPCMIHFDGLDVTKEILYLMGMPGALAERGVGCLVVDNPGVGESLRLRGLHNGPEAERPARAAFDFLAARAEIDQRRIGIMALSLGGYHAPRAAAFEPRLACAVAWGAQYDWGVIQRGRANDPASSLPVPHYWDHVGWVFGASGMDEIMRVSSQISLVGILDRIHCPILVAHGENDRQIPLAAAERVIAECVNSPRRELIVQRLADGGAEHCSIDNVPLICETIGDWVADVLGTAGRA
jgi:dienelactone hydrolase